MPLRLRKEALWGIAASAFIAVLIMGSAVIISLRRMIHRRQIARLFPQSEGRSRCHPRCHMSLTDDDVARIPGTQKALRNSMQTRPSRRYTNLPSRENLVGRQFPTVQPQGSNLHESKSAPSWPLSPRLQRSNATPLVKLKPSPLTPIDENSIKRPGKTLSISKPPRAKESLDNNTKERRQPELQKNEHNPDSNVFTTVALKPKPLFHNKQRSISTPIVLRKADEHVTQSEPKADIDITRQKRESRLPRSTSLCSQQSGKVPDWPVPPLPFNFSTSTKFERVQSPIESSSKWTSGNSFLSGDTSILDGTASRVTSQAETELTSVSAFSPPIYGNLLRHDMPNEQHPPEFQGLVNFSDPFNSKLNFNPEIRRSFRASLVHSLPRSASSGLSMSLLDHGPTRNVSSTSLRTDGSSPCKINLVVPRSGDRKSLIRRGISPASPLKKSVLFESREDFKSKRASTSILQVVSGNGSSPLNHRLENRPSSIATSDPFQWDLMESMRRGVPSKLKGQAKGHNRQMDLKIKHVGGTAISITNIQPTIPLECSPMVNKKDREEYATVSRSAIDEHVLLRPPSRVTFDPQIRRSPRDTSPQDSRATTCSPTLSMVEFYNGDAHSSAESTPTKIPGAQPSGSNPNRHKTIFSDQSTGNWSFLMPSIKSPTEPAPGLDLESAQSRPCSSQSSFISDGSFLFPLPPVDPSKRRRRPTSQVRGPRSPPPRLPRRSPLRGVSKPSNNNNSPGPDLRKSIVAIRRRNSEAKDLDPEHHARYLNFGFSDTPILEDEPEAADDGDAGEKDGGALVYGPRMMPRAIDGVRA